MMPSIAEFSVVCWLLLSNILRIVEPIDVVNIFLNLLAKANGLDIKIFKAFILGVDNEILGLCCHELWEEPCTEKLSVEWLPPFVVIIFVNIFKLYNSCVRLNSCLVKELFVYLFIGISVRATEIITLANCLFHLKAIEDCESNVIYKYRLNTAIHTFSEPVHAIEHLHLHTPFSSKCSIRME